MNKHSVVTSAQWNDEMKRVPEDHLPDRELLAMLRERRAKVRLDRVLLVGLLAACALGMLIGGLLVLEGVF